jgi:hypothetical protein
VRQIIDDRGFEREPEPLTPIGPQPGAAWEWAGTWLVEFEGSGLAVDDLISIFVSLGRDVARAAAGLAAPCEPQPDPPSFAADVPASALPDDLREALRQVVSDYGVRIPAHNEPACSRCGLWEATEGLPEMPVCPKCYHDIVSGRDSGLKGYASFTVDRTVWAIERDMYAALRDAVGRYGVAIPGESDKPCAACGFWAADSGDICSLCVSQAEDSK